MWLSSIEMLVDNLLETVMLNPLKLFVTQILVSKHRF
jgi:hypothetical protein